MFQNYYNPQASIDRINSQIAELEKMKANIPSVPVQNGQPAINQTFQLAPNPQNAIRYANSIEEVQKEIVIADTPYFSKDLSVLWIKNTKGEIKSYELQEIVQKDQKDIQIEYLQAQIEELKGMIKNESNANAHEPTSNAVESKEPTRLPAISKPNKKSK